MQKPNILFILTDDQGSWALRCAGNNDIYTPNLDELAKNGIIHDNFFCCSPVCSPARASIFTGKMPSSHGVHDWICGGNVTTEKYKDANGEPYFSNADIGVEYLQNETLFTQKLAENGYTCALSGKWHLGNNDIAKKGFERWFTIATGGCDHYYSADIYEDGAFHKSKRYITDEITDKALEFISDFSQQENPFYLSVHYTAPHSPWSADNHPQEVLELYNECEFKATPDLPVHIDQIHSAPIGDTQQKRTQNLKGYYAAITAMDSGVGKIIEELKSKGLYDNTIVIFTSDNGMNMGHHGVWGKGNGTYPLNMYDTSVKVPLIVSHPACFMKDIVICDMQSHYDLYPTILDMAGINNADNIRPGKSMLQQWLGKRKQTKQEVFIYDEYGAVRMIRTSCEKYIKNYTSGAEIYYNLSIDPDETENRINNLEYAKNIDSLKKRMQEWFLKNETTKNSGAQYDVRGRGQLNLCDKNGAFSEIISYYHKCRQKDNVEIK